MVNEFQELTEFLDQVEAHYGVPACDCIIAKDGETIYRHRAGALEDSGQACDETYWIYSATKISTCVAALQLMEQGKLARTDPVGKYLPEFQALTVREKDGQVRPANTEMTVLHLMTMTGGLDYDLTRPALKEALNEPVEKQTTRNIAAALAKDPLVFDPGTHFRYSFCHDVLGAVIEAAAGQRLNDYMQEKLFGPLGMTDTTFCPTEEQRARMLTQYAHSDNKGTLRDWNQENEWRFSVNYDSGGAGLMSTAGDYIRLLSALSLGGVSPEGKRILKPESVTRMASPWLGDACLADFHARSAAMKGYSYGLGVRVLIDNHDICSPLGEFGWDGAAGAYAYIDPVNHIAMYYAQQVYNCPIVYFQLHPRLRDIAGRCLRRLI